MKKPRVLCSYQVKEQRPFFHILDGVAEWDEIGVDQEALDRRLPEYDAFYLTLGLLLREGLIRRCPRLKLVVAGSTGTDHIDCDALKELGIDLLSLKYDTEFLSKVSATAEQAWALMLAVIRHVPAAFDSVKRGEWDRTKFRGTQLRGKTFGILGYGRLGRIIQDFALGFHMRVLANDVKDFEPAPGVEKVDLETLLQESDVLSIHIHLTPENYHFMNRERIFKMKKGAVLINTARGACVDEAALIEALEREHLAGAGVDVLENEWEMDIARHLMARYARTHENLVISPHLAGATYESMNMSTEFCMHKLKRVIAERFG